MRSCVVGVLLMSPAYFLMIRLGTCSCVSCVCLWTVHIYQVYSFTQPLNKLQTDKQIHIRFEGPVALAVTSAIL